MPVPPSDGRMTVAAGLHTVLAVVAIVAGGTNILLPKGTPRHRTLGRVYALAMVALCAVSFGIREIEDGRLSVFHVISVQATLFVALGVGAARLRHRIHSWALWHARFILYSWVTLVVTGIAQAWDVLPLDSEVARAVVFIQLPAVVGWVLIEFVGMPRWRRRFDRPTGAAA